MPWMVMKYVKFSDTWRAPVAGFARQNDCRQEFGQCFSVAWKIAGEFVPLLNPPTRAAKWRSEPGAPTRASGIVPMRIRRPLLRARVAAP